MKVTITKAGAVVTLEPGDKLGEPHIVWGGPPTTFPPVPVTGDEEAIAVLTKGYLAGGLSLDPQTKSASLPSEPDRVVCGEPDCGVCSELNCEVCGKPACGVCASPLGAISHAICMECLQEHRVPWGELIAGLCGVTRDGVADWVKPYIEATRLFFDKSEDELWEEIDKFTKEYEAACRKSQCPDERSPDEQG